MTATASPLPELAGRGRGGSLAGRIFLATALLILLAVGVSVLVTAWYGRKIAREAATAALDNSYETQRSFDGQRYRTLQLISQLFVEAAEFAPYLAESEAQGEAGTLSMLDLLDDRQRSLEFDFAIALDATGRVIAHTSRNTPRGTDLSRLSLVKAAMDPESGGEAAGVWVEDGTLYDAVVKAAARGGTVFGYLVTGFEIDDNLASDIESSSRAEVAFVAHGDTGPEVGGTTLNADESKALVAALRPRWNALRAEMRDPDSVERLDLELDGEPWLGLLTPLSDASGETVGASVALSSLARQVAPYRRIQWVLTGVGLAAMLSALALSYPLAQRILKPVRVLVGAAEAARRGDYDRPIDTASKDEVGRLARAFDDLLADLRQKRDMEAYMGQLARTLPEPAGAGSVEPSTAGSATVLIFDLRRYARAGDAGVTLERLGRDLRRIANAALAQDGRLESLLGQRALVAFFGEDGPRRALAAVVEAYRSLCAIPDLDPAEAPVVVIAAGTVVRGGVAWGDQPRRVLVGLPVVQLDGLLREAAPGDILLSAAVALEVGPVLERSGVRLVAGNSLVSGQRLFSLRAEDLAKLGSAGPVAEAETVHLEPEKPVPAPVAAVTPATPMVTLAQLAPGAVLGGRFEILSVLGAGGMGVVYKAQDRELDDVIALKVLKRESWGSEEFLARLKEELKLARKITHPNVLRTFDFGDVDGVPFVSMEYVRGVTLRYMLDRTDRLPFTAALRLARQIAGGLGAAHAQGVIHRDIKPENLILDSAGNVKLMDFGIARPQDRIEAGPTRAGFVVGTPQYLSPEQLKGEPATARSDVYSLGIVLYEVFTGRLPFRAADLMATISQHLHEAPAPPSQHWSAIPAPLEAILLRSLSKTPAERFADSNALLQELEGIHA